MTQPSERRVHRTHPTRFRWMRPDVWAAAPGRLKTVLVSYPTQPLELFAGVGSILRGIWWILADPGADAAAVMLENLLPVHWLGVSLSLLGLLQVFGVALKAEGLRRASAALIVGSTSLILVTTLVVEPTSRIVPALALVVMMEFVVVLRVGPWTDFPFAPKRGEGPPLPPTRGVIGVKLMELVAFIGVVGLFAKEAADHITAAGMWIPVVVSSLTTVLALILNNHFQTRRIARRQDLQAPVRQFKEVQLYMDEGEQIRKELRIELEYKGKENARLRSIIDAKEKHIAYLDEQLLLVHGQLRECHEECIRLRGTTSLKTG